MPRVLMYCTKTCPYCLRAEKLLKQKGIAPEVIDVGGRPEMWKEMEKLSGRNTVPQIWIGDVHVGGCDDLHALERQGKLDELLNQE